MYPDQGINIKTGRKKMEDAKAATAAAVEDIPPPRTRTNIEENITHYRPREQISGECNNIIHRPGAASVIDFDVIKRFKKKQ